MQCSNCEYLEENNCNIDIKVKGHFLRPGKRYCSHGKIREISRKSLGKYLYPVWCPLNTYKGTCLYCGTRIREEEGEICAECKKKGL